MIRRRRRAREIPFSFDSFLDVVANVCGIIIRLILVVWVGARSYSSLQQVAQEPEPEPVAEAVAEPEPAEPSDPLQDELAQERRRLAEAEAALLEHLRLVHGVQDWQEKTRQELTALSARRQALAGERAALDRRTADQTKAAQEAALSLEELRRRCGRLTEEIREVQKLPPARQALRYRTPVSKPLDSEELMFECRGGKVTFLDIAALLEEVKRSLHDKGDTLRRTWEVSDVAGPVGPFQLRYTVERERDALDPGLAGGTPDTKAGFRYGVSGWHVEPVTEVRGEALEQALRPGSEFRQITDGLDPQHAAVTFWVYPDSFGVYRRLRDYLYERDLVVAGRPLPDGVPISSSRHGTVSRGQ
jgi:hypothetical protein